MSDSPAPHVRLIGQPQSVPVFNCRIIVSPRTATGEVTARAAELPDLTAAGSSQREAIQKLVAAFKTRITEHVAKQEEVPWVLPGDTAQPGEQELFTAVHL